MKTALFLTTTIVLLKLTLSNGEGEKLPSTDSVITKQTDGGGSLEGDKEENKKPLQTNEHDSITGLEKTPAIQEKNEENIKDEDQSIKKSTTVHDGLNIATAVKDGADEEEEASIIIEGDDDDDDEEVEDDDDFDDEEDVEKATDKTGELKFLDDIQCKEVWDKAKASQEEWFKGVTETVNLLCQMKNGGCELSEPYATMGVLHMTYSYYYGHDVLMIKTKSKTSIEERCSDLNVNWEKKGERMRPMDQAKEVGRFYKNTLGKPAVNHMRTRKKKKKKV